MSYQYRIAQPEETRFLAQMQTAAGWTTIASFANLQDAIQEINRDKSRRAFTPKYYDETGAIMADTAPTTNQPVGNA